jgi:hypothetical protein
MLSESNSSEIYSLVALLEALGFKLKINRADFELSAECTADRSTIEIAEQVR